MTNEISWSLLEEDEEDIELSASSDLIDEIRQTVVFTLDWSVGSLLEQLRAGSIDLQPQYQRRDAWTVPLKSRLIESLILGLPVPQLVLAEMRDRKGEFLVLDGKQRLTALLQFAGGMATSKANGFRLSELPVLRELNGVSFEAMKDRESGSGHLSALLNQPVRTVILRGWRSDELLHLVFHRLNSNVVPLSPQELRQALIRGPFLPYLNDVSAESTTLQRLLRLTGPDFRMRDSELLLRLLAFSLFTEDYRGDLRRFLDAAAHRLNQNWDSDRQRIEQVLVDLQARIDLWASALDGHHRVGRR
ncbi:MAG: GmrSD restriction endonuclease domain-containing protein, partial [Gemmatimonadaceae bacterium]